MLWKLSQNTLATTPQQLAFISNIENKSDKLVFEVSLIFFILLNLTFHFSFAVLNVLNAARNLSTFKSLWYLYHTF